MLLAIHRHLISKQDCEICNTARGGPESNTGLNNRVSEAEQHVPAASISTGGSGWVEEAQPKAQARDGRSLAVVFLNAIGKASLEGAEEPLKTTLSIQKLERFHRSASHGR